MKKHHPLCESHSSEGNEDCICAQIEQARADERRRVVRLAISLQGSSYTNDNRIDACDLIETINGSAWISYPYWE